MAVYSSPELWYFSYQHKVIEKAALERISKKRSRSLIEGDGGHQGDEDIEPKRLEASGLREAGHHTETAAAVTK